VDQDGSGRSIPLSGRLAFRRAGRFLDRYRAALDAMFPREREGLERFFEDVRRAYLAGCSTISAVRTAIASIRIAA
jgi:hypothetical protein